jgi:hypothetical protein
VAVRTATHSQTSKEGDPNMGKPSDRKRRARHRRPGKRERARAKKPRRGTTYGSVFGAGTYELKAGRKKSDEFNRSWRNPFGWHRLCAQPLKYGETSEIGERPIITGNHISKAGTPMLDGQTTGKTVQFRPTGINSEAHP